MPDKSLFHIAAVRPRPILAAALLLLAILAVLFFVFTAIPTIRGADIGIIETNLTAEQVSQATMASIKNRDGLMPATASATGPF